MSALTEFMPNKGDIGPRLRPRSFLAQPTKTPIGVAILNRMLARGRPKSVRCGALTGVTNKPPIKDRMMTCRRTLHQTPRGSEQW
jgi:hypothetical protein